MGTVGAMLVFALNNPQSMEDLERWRQEIVQYANDNCAIVLIGIPHREYQLES